MDRKIFALHDDQASTGVLGMLRMPACRIDRGGRLLAVNAAWRRLAGLPAYGRIEMDWLGLVAPEDREAAQQRFLQLPPQGELAEWECHLYETPELSRRHMLSLQPWQGHRAGASDGDWLCVATDIHALTLKEAALESRAQIQAEMLNIGVDCIKLISVDGSLIHLNRAGCLALGVSEDSSFGMPWLGLLPPEVRAAGEVALAQARQGHPSRFAGRSVLPGQAPQHWDNMLTPVKDAQGHVTSILCVSREVTAERAAQDSLRLSEERLQLAARVGGLGIWDYDLQRDQLHCDDSWYRIMGRDAARPIRSIEEFRPMIHPDDVEIATNIDARATGVLNGEGNYGIEFRIVRPNGDVRWLRSAACVLQDDQGQPSRAVGFVIDITNAKRGELALRDANRELALQRESFARQSLEDPLTGLANRRCLDLELAGICLRVGHEHRPVSIAMVDVDFFKAYNDRYGHPAGDLALRGLASALQAIARRTDLVARYGGEEFVIVLPGVDKPEAALLRLAEAIADLGIVHQDSPYGQLTASVGCVVFPVGSLLTPLALLDACDKALYEAKALGRNRHVLRTSGQTEVGVISPGAVRPA